MLREKIQNIKKKHPKLFRKRVLILVILFIFLVWMLFFDDNSYRRHRQLNEEIQTLHQEKKILKEQIERDRKKLEGFNSNEGKIKFGREQYYFKKNNEDIFVIEYDTIKK